MRIQCKHIYSLILYAMYLIVNFSNRPSNLVYSGEHEVRCVRRKLLLESLEKELPDGTIRYSSKVVSIEESGYSKLVHLADDTIIKTKV